MSVLALILVFAAVCFYEVPTLLRRRFWRELIAFICVAGLAFTLGLLMLIGVETPNPAVWMDRAAKWMVSLFR